MSAPNDEINERIRKESDRLDGAVMEAVEQFVRSSPLPLCEIQIAVAATLIVLAARAHEASAPATPFSEAAALYDSCIAVAMRAAMN